MAAQGPCWSSSSDLITHPGCSHKLDFPAKLYKILAEKQQKNFLFPPSPQFKSVPTGGHTWPQGWTSGQIITWLFHPHPTRACSSLTNIQLKYIHFYLQEEYILNSFALGVLFWLSDFFKKFIHRTIQILNCSLTPQCHLKKTEYLKTSRETKNKDIAKWST